MIIKLKKTIFTYTLPTYYLFSFNKKINFKGICNRIINEYKLDKNNIIFIIRYHEIFNRIKNITASKIKISIIPLNINDDTLLSNIYDVSVTRFYTNEIYKIIPYKRESLKNYDIIKLDENYETKTIYREIN